MKCNPRFLLLLLPVFAGFAQAQGSGASQNETGLAAVYSHRLDHHMTSSGQIYSPSKMTAAHKSLPYGTRIRVTNPKNNRSVIVRINDRGPTQAGRILDLSPAAAHHIGIGVRSMREVNLQVLEAGNGKTRHQGKS